MIHLQLTPFPVLSTERLLLRNFQPEDAEALFELRSDPQIMQYINRPVAKAVTEVSELIERIMAETQQNKSVAWCICQKENQRLIGFIGLWRMEPENLRGELGYMLHPLHHKKGFMQEALEAVLEYGFKTILCHTIMADVHPGNKSSINLLERNQFLREAYFHENIFFEGQYHDTVIYCRINPYEGK
ncbi:MAG: GNAT family N-acetyltransferase [Bacteroidia bacterium]